DAVDPLTGHQRIGVDGILAERAPDERAALLGVAGVPGCDVVVDEVGDLGHGALLPLVCRHAARERCGCRLPARESRRGGWSGRVWAMSTVAAGEMLRTWRQRRKLSQFELSLTAAVSSRHLSFVETGRAKPSREMLLHLADRLEIPLRDRNELLLAAG